VNKQVLTPETVKQTAYGLMTQEQREYFNEELELDFAISEPGLGRFRVNVFMQRGYPAMVLRYITAEMPRSRISACPTSDRSGHAEARHDAHGGRDGLGKSTTLAAMINYRNENSSDHIVTIEDPIEFLHTNKKSIVNQREVGLDTKSFARALRSAVRAAPDVILIGEIRDRESMEAAIHARRHRAPRARDHARQQQRGDARPHHQHVSARPAQSDLPRPVAVPARDPGAAPGHG
jgi:twitching motility protein PilU